MVSYGLGGPTLCIYIYMYISIADGFPNWFPERGGTPKSSILIINPAFWGTLSLNKLHITKQMQLSYQKSAIDSNS